MNRSRQTEVIAERVGGLPQYDVLFMAVSAMLVEQCRDWSEPVRFRFVRVGDRGCELELRRDYGEAEDDAA